MSSEKPRDPTRRRFLIHSALAAGALTIGIQSTRSSPDGEAAGSTDSFVPDACLEIGPTGILVRIPHAEMGQGVMTSLAMLIAEELDVDLDQVDVELAAADRSFDHPQWRIQMTGGSTSIRARFMPFRQAGAAARELLIRAAALRLGVDASELGTQRGEVVCERLGARLSYSELARDAARLQLPESVRLKSADEFRIIGTRPPRFDIPSKVDGSCTFGIDVRLPGLRVASIERCPTFGGRARTFDARRALAVPGVSAVVQISTGIAVVADHYWNAWKGRQALVIDWDLGPHEGLGDDHVREEYRRLSHSPAKSVRSEGSASDALAAAQEIFGAAYELPYLAHACLEPMNATADVRPDGCTVYAPTQSPGLARSTAATITGLPLELVRVQPTHLGGGFGRRSETDFVAEAVEVSMAIGAPVKVVWSREDDLAHDFYRPASYHVLRAAIDASGTAHSWTHRIVGPPILQRVIGDMTRAALPDGVPNLLKGMVSGMVRWAAARRTDSTLVEGAEEVPYEFPHLSVEYASHDDAFVPVGFWRSVGHSHNAFAVESFIDELAHRAGRDPYAYRRERLSNAPRHRAVLDAVAEHSRWLTPPQPGVHRGIAVHGSFGSYVAMVVELSVSASGTIRVHDVFVAVDAGLVVHPDTVEAQIEGAIAFGLSAAIKKSRIDIRNGGVVQRNFDDYELLRIDEMPRVHTHILPSREDPGGVGEIGTPPIAPAVANAVFSATGVRLRSLPLRMPSSSS